MKKLSVCIQSHGLDPEHLSSLLLQNRIHINLLFFFYITILLSDLRIYKLTYKGKSYNIRCTSVAFPNKVHCHK